MVISGGLGGKMGSGDTDGHIKGVVFEGGGRGGREGGATKYKAYLPNIFLVQSGPCSSRRFTISCME